MGFKVIAYHPSIAAGAVCRGINFRKDEPYNEDAALSLQAVETLLSDKSRSIDCIDVTKKRTTHCENLWITLCSRLYRAN